MSEYLNVISRSSNHAIELARRLLTLSSKEIIKFEDVDLNLVVEEVCGFCRSTFAGKVTFEVKLHESAALIRADKARLEQALLNLCFNAAHAVTCISGESKRGRVVLSVELRTVDGILGQAYSEALGSNHWVIIVHDEGVGMDAETQAKIFDPFYTTKGQGEGTGLGLMMVKNIVEAHGGFIDVHSQPGRGSIFSLYLKVAS